jgi:DNA invertase Pin-like site-specific DNA recombinase
MKCALYHRVSTRDQNPALVREQLRDAARVRAFQVEMEVEETGSGARNDRPGLQAVLDAARAGRVKAVVVWKLDRFGRSVVDLLTNLQTLSACGCRFVAAGQGLEDGPGSDPAARLNLRVVAAVAEYELDMIRDRTHTGLAPIKRALAEGKPWVGRKSGRVIHSLGRPEVKVDVARARALFIAGDGASWSSVARALGVSRGTLRKALSKKGAEFDGDKVAENQGQGPAGTDGK